MTHVIACIDGSTSAPAVCDYAAWASLSLEAPLTFLHVLDQRQYPVAADLSGNIGLGSREHLLWVIGREVAHERAIGGARLKDFGAVRRLRCESR